MVEIAFGGQNQPLFQRASEIIKRVHNIEISYNTVRKITEYVGKIVYDYNYAKAKEINNKKTSI